MRYVLGLFIGLGLGLLVNHQVQAFGKPPVNQAAAKVRRDMDYLCGERLQGRQTGQEGESMAAQYIEGRFKGIGLQAWQGNYTDNFSLNTGARPAPQANLNLNGHALKSGTEVIFMPYAKSAKIKGFCYPQVFEPKNVWMISVKKMQTEIGSNLQAALYLKAKTAQEAGAQSVVFYNDTDQQTELDQQQLQLFPSLSIPVVWVTAQAWQQYALPYLKNDWLDVEGQVLFEDAMLTGKNVYGYINNNALYTTLIIAHYDHLGEGFTGADNNASGVSALLNLAEQIKGAGLKRYNYLFVALSGREQNHEGAKVFIQRNDSLFQHVSAVFELDMLGRFNPVSRELYLAGAGTSSQWQQILQLGAKGFNIQVDSSGYTMSDVRFFYEKNIPVLRISTGYHDDFNRTSDVLEKVNITDMPEVIQGVFRMVNESDKLARPVFVKTNDYFQKMNNLRGTLQIIPDIVWPGEGLRVAAVFPNKKSDIAGMKSGDIITKLGVYPIYDMDDYLEAIRKTETGREISVKIKRGEQEFTFYITL
ncbi:MAG: M28 family peptidase [Chitinophagaceae bacterium]